ncbi:guanine deaminase [Candidatus Symbiopectobacterium sp. NZEC127]|uniref:guanine deaminase n=1 Tax=Candidatus Symbiopectobacterium sp. NZEC127 TaxID=2820472 RepID=UPI0022271DCF|nr:guanine deaminase [Candidatus Symbiopectobacterium sp. NZEC127]MCW2486069.1 guanine deaminase [Candidatus Symbiopectobacterium sp. NZEC127]
MTVCNRYAIRSAFFDIVAPAENPQQIVEHARYIEDGVLLIDKGKIVDLVPWQQGEARVKTGWSLIDYRGKVILPGFIDTHIHFPQAEIIGAYGEQLLEWLERYTFPAESHYGDMHYATRMAAFFLQQLLSNGTTSAMVFATVHPESVEALFSAAQGLGMRLIAGKVMMDCNAPDNLVETAESSHRQCQALIRRWHGRGRLGYAITPRFAPTSSPELLSAAQRLREEFPDTWLQTHLSENPQEVAWVRELYPDRDNYLDVYHHYRLTGRRSVFAHAIHLDEAEWDCLHQTQSAVAFCPSSNLFLGSGLFRLQQSWHKGVRIGMGTDVGAGTSFSLLQTLGDAYKVGQLQQYRLSACEAFYHATLGGACALDLEHEIGNFAAGKTADFVVIDPAVTALQRLRDDKCQDIMERLFVLMTLGDDRNVVATWVNGRPVWQADCQEVAA